MKKLFAHDQGPLPRGRGASVEAGRRWRPVLEGLEDRVLLATFTVVDLGDGGVGSGLRGDLRYCIDAANSNHDLSNRIVFQPGLTGTITLTQDRLVVDKNLEVIGPGADRLTVSGNHQSAVFEIANDPRARDVRLSGLTVADGTGILRQDGGSLMQEGGGLFNWHANLMLTDCVFTENAAGDFHNRGRGGAIYSVAGTLVLTNCTITDNQAAPGDGGGVYLVGGALALNQCIISGNSARYNGGGIYNANGVLTATDTTVSSNTSGFEGGGIDDHNQMTLTNCTIAGNVSSGFAGGIGAQGFDTLTNCTIADNTAGGDVGGGIFVASQLTLNGCTISGNSAVAVGGGLVLDGGTVSATICTFSGNTVKDGPGGAIYVDNLSHSSFLELTSCTLTQNRGADGGGLAIFSASLAVLVRNTILAGNQAAGQAVDMKGAVLSLGHNLVGQVDGSSGWQTSDLTGTSASPLDPRLGPLQINGGPTLTQAPFADSPAVDNGDPTLYRSVDQRGTFRNFDGIAARPDIGAVEAETAVSFRVLVPDRVTAGEPFALTVMALDQWGNTATSYSGTVHFDSTDLGAVLPADYTFAAADQGVQLFAVTLNTPGSQAVQVTDLSDGSLTAVAATTVDGFPAGSAGALGLGGLGDWVFDETGWHPRHDSMDLVVVSLR